MSTFDSLPKFAFDAYHLAYDYPFVVLLGLFAVAAILRLLSCPGQARFEQEAAHRPEMSKSA